MPFHKGSTSSTSDASEGNSMTVDDKKKKTKKPETKSTMTVTTTSVSKSKDKKSTTTTTRSNSTTKRGRSAVANNQDDGEQEIPKRTCSTGTGKHIESNTQEAKTMKQQKNQTKEVCRKWQCCK